MSSAWVGFLWGAPWIPPKAALSHWHMLWIQWSGRSDSEFESISKGKLFPNFLLKTLHNSFPRKSFPYLEIQKRNFWEGNEWNEAEKVFSSSSYIKHLLKRNGRPLYTKCFNPSRLLTYGFLPVFNFWLILCPHHLSYDWQMGSIPLLNSFSDPRNLATLFFYPIFAAFIIHAVTKVKNIQQFEKVSKIKLVNYIPFTCLPYQKTMGSWFERREQHPRESCWREELSLGGTKVKSALGVMRCW
jgi:hypothetical protein